MYKCIAKWESLKSPHSSIHNKHLAQTIYLSEGCRPSLRFRTPQIQTARALMRTFICLSDRSRSRGACLPPISATAGLFLVTPHHRYFTRPLSAWREILFLQSMETDSISCKQILWETNLNFEQGKLGRA